MGRILFCPRNNLFFPKNNPARQEFLAEVKPFLQKLTIVGEPDGFSCHVHVF